MDLVTFASMVAAKPCLHPISFDQLLLFIASIEALKDDVLLIQPSNHDPVSPPDVLPRSVQYFLSQACTLSVDAIQECWSTFKHLVWQEGDAISSVLRAPLPVFHKHGIPHGFTGRTLYPPNHFCSTPNCPRTLKGMRMMHAEQRQCVLYTVSNGLLPVYSIHLSCEVCEVNYHHNFKVYKGERVYYGGIPDFLQITEHRFVERQVVEMWLALMDNWTSATGCAKFYNTAMSRSNEPPLDWLFGFTLLPDDVWCAFVLYCLLEDTLERQEYLIVKHTGDQRDRFSGLMLMRNQRMRIEGQPEVTHFCDKCTRWYLSADGTVERKCSVVVTDGVCIGHPCCSTHNCQVLLHSGKDRFCPVHADLENICAIIGCDERAAEGHLTCTNSEHRGIEQLHHEKGQSRFQLRDRLERARTLHPSNHSSNSRALAQLAVLDNDDDIFAIHGNGHITAGDDLSQDPSTAKARRVRAKFTRSRTHNEQLAVAPCGMILGRDTMFGAEGVASVAEFLKRTFRIEALKPDHVFFDNNCSLAQHVKSDPFFSNIGLTVDVFHFKSKHKETHTFCQENCNPAAYLELISEDGQGWFFNSSAAEQANIWLGGYHAICREMLVDKFDFFLDEMIMRHNCVTKAKLKSRGFRPSNWPV